MNWSKLFIQARGGLSQSQAAERIAPGLLSVRTVQEWEQGRRVPPGWVQWLVLRRLKRGKH